MWDRGFSSGQPYVVAVLERNGYPAEPTPAFFSKLWHSRADNVHQGRTSWADQVARDQANHDEEREAATSVRFRERVQDGKDKVLSMFGHGKKHSLNRSLIPNRRKPRVK